MMINKSKIFTAAGTIGCAVGIGFVMQNTSEVQSLYDKGAAYVAPAPAPAPVATVAGVEPDNMVLDVQQVKLTSASFETNVALPQADPEVTTVATPQSVLPAPLSPPALTPACDIIASARPVAAAMVDLTLEATCFPNERLTVHHSGMVFTETTNNEGTVSLRVPALSKDAQFIVAFSNGEGAVAETTVEELDDFHRVVVQWKGDTGFQIHAREFGADYGSEGHLWQGAPSDVSAAVAGVGGVLTRHGDLDQADPLVAEVYSFPKRYIDKSGEVLISVETEVTTANCGLEIEAQSLEVMPRGEIKKHNLTLAVPACDAEGSFLVLNNLLQDLKVAAR